MIALHVSILFAFATPLESTNVSLLVPFAYHDMFTLFASVPGGTSHCEYTSPLYCMSIRFLLDLVS